MGGVFHSRSAFTGFTTLAADVADDGPMTRQTQAILPGHRQFRILRTVCKNSFGAYAQKAPKLPSKPR